MAKMIETWEYADHTFVDGLDLPVELRITFPCPLSRDEVDVATDKNLNLCTGKSVCPSCGQDVDVVYAGEVPA